MELPASGRPLDDVLGDLDALAADDKDFRRGGTFGLVFHATDELEAALTAAHTRYLWHNALSPDAFPSLRRMQADVVAIASSLFHGDADVAGAMTSGGTESIILAVKAAKQRAARERDVTHGNVVMATTAHAAFDKGCDYFSLEPRRVPVRDDWRADVDAMASAIDGDTVLLVASAPQYPQGVIDPVAAVAALARERDVSCHVDACMGGFVLPFMADLGYALPAWDFAVDGVTSISADVHKYGYVPKGASVLLHRTRTLRNDHVFLFDGWLGGQYGSTGILGTKPGGPIAAAWATFQLLGRVGFVEQTGRAVRARERLCAGVDALDDLAIVGRPEATMAAITSDGVDVFAVHAELDRRGWHLDRQAPPDSMHATCMPVHDDVMDDFLADLRDAVAVVGEGRATDRSTSYAQAE